MSKLVPRANSISSVIAGMNYRPGAYYRDIAGALSYYADLLRVHQLALKFSGAHKTVSHDCELSLNYELPLVSVLTGKRAISLTLN